MLLAAPTFSQSELPEPPLRPVHATRDPTVRNVEGEHLLTLNPNHSQGYSHVFFLPTPLGETSLMPETGCYGVCFLNGDGICEAGTVHPDDLAPPFEAFDIRRTAQNGGCEGEPITLPVTLADHEQITLRFSFSPTTSSREEDYWGVAFQLVGGTLTIADTVVGALEVPSGDWYELPNPATAVAGGPLHFGVLVRNTAPRGDFARLTLSEDGEELPGLARNFFVPPGGDVVPGQKWLHSFWLTDEFAWQDDGTEDEAVHILSSVEAPFGIPGSFGSRELTAHILPKPVIFVHGLFSNATTWDGYPEYLRSKHTSWEGFAIDTMDTGSILFPPSSGETIATNATRLRDFIEAVRQDRQAWQVDIASHSLGGLISRQYIHFLMPLATPFDLGVVPAVDKLLTIGTPHLGSRCGNPSFHPATKQVTPQALNLFNQEVFQRNGVDFIGFAGNAYNDKRCGWPKQYNDNTVTVVSATNDLNNYTLAPAQHDRMTSPSNIYVTAFLQDSLSGGQPPPKQLPPFTQTETQNLGSDYIYFNTVQVGPGQTESIDFSIPSGLDSFGVDLINCCGLVREVTDPAGAPLAELEGSDGDFWHVAMDEPPSGTWTLNLTNPGSSAVEQPVTVWVRGYGFDLLPSARWLEDGQISVTACTLWVFGCFTEPESVSAVIRDVENPEEDIPISLYDNGTQGDSEPKDGVFSFVTPPLDQGRDYTVVISILLPDGTTLIEEQHLPLRTVIFRDGFESGDTSAWRD